MSFPVSSSPARSKRLPAKRAGSSRTRTATALDVRDGDLRDRPRRREGRRVDPFGQLLLREGEVLHEVDGRENRRANAELGESVFSTSYLLSKCGMPVCRVRPDPTESEDEMHPSGLGGGGGGDALSGLGIRTSAERRRHREERGRPSRAPSRSPQCLHERRHDERRLRPPASDFAWIESRSRVTARTLWPRPREAMRDGAALFTRGSRDDDG